MTANNRIAQVLGPLDQGLTPLRTILFCLIGWSCFAPFSSYLLGMGLCWWGIGLLLIAIQNAHSLDLIGQPEEFKHQFLANIAKARQLLSKHANRSGFTLKDEYLRPLTAKQPLQQPILWILRQLGSDQDQAWSMGSIFVFENELILPHK